MEGRRSGRESGGIGQGQRRVGEGLLDRSRVNVLPPPFSGAQCHSAAVYAYLLGKLSTFLGKISEEEMMEKERG